MKQDKDPLTQARVAVILNRDVTPQALATLRQEAGAPPLHRQAQANPYRLAPLMRDELNKGRKRPLGASMASRTGDGDEADLPASLSALGVWP